MNRISRLACLSVLPLAAFAAPDASLVPADAKWMVYADFSTLRNSVLGKEVIANVEKEFAASESPIVPNLPKILATIGSATAYGTSFSDKPEEMDGTLVVQGTADLRKIVDGLLAAQTELNPEHIVDLSKDYGFSAYGFKAGPPPRKPAMKEGEAEKPTEAPKAAKKDSAPRDPNKIELIIALPAKPENVVLVGRSKALISRARDLASGSGASLAKSNASPLKRFLTSGDDAYLFAATIKPDNKAVAEAGTHGTEGRILQMANAGSLSVGEHAAEAYAHLEVVASSDAMADKLMKIMQGLTATISLMETNDRQLGEFLNAATVNRDGDKVVVNLAYPSARLVQMGNNFRSMSAPLASRPPQAPATNGRSVATWKGEAYAAPADPGSNTERSHVIDNVVLKTGSTITLGRSLNGARYSRFTKVEIAPVGGGSPLAFSSFNQMGGRNPAASFEFPGADGTYTLKVTTLVGDPEGKIDYALSVRDPRPAADAR